MSEYLQGFLRASRGKRGIYSVCSAHPWVIEAAMRQALEDDTHLLLEATSNQVNQTGGYTGMTPADFRDFAHAIAEAAGFDPTRLVLGGDHLGPNPWQHLDAKTAMDRAAQMVRAYAAAGFTKIHLDASMRCADDPEIVSDEVMAKRAALLCGAAEAECQRLALSPIVYVIGTEVPVPGGAAHRLQMIEITSSQAAERTLSVHHDAFRDQGLSSAWERVLAVVVQPGVEFDHHSVVDYDAAKATDLRSFLEAHPELVLEAHSTDYQNPQAYRELIRDGFAILKVGPQLTFVLRETLYALAAIERELVPELQRSHIVETMEQIMLAHPSNWQKYYPGSAEKQRLLRIYSYSDRIRYYWKSREAETSVERLLKNLEQFEIPETLLSQYLPRQYDKVRAGTLRNDPKALIIENIQTALAPYSRACQGDYCS